ncbi:MAG: hypothetical protein QOC81_424 [Thermoanaerobaculia bacterium]|jgi:hypothetical protein|nr:hypothetical protein [Thermoanaerobaculia bacterium]
MKLEKQLQRTLARTSAPDGFADRVLARLGEARSRRASRWPAASTLRRIAAALLLTAALGGLTAHQIAEHRREEGELARREVMTALHIASAKMRVAQRAVAHD